CSTLDFLRNRCAGNIHSLSKNHRSPKYLLDIFNTYAVKQMGISPDLLPSTSFQPTTMGNELQWFQSDTIETEYLDAAQQAVRMLHDFPEDTTAIIVNSNRDADGVSDGLKQLKAPHFKVSGEDLFSSPQIKLLFAHLTIMNNPHNFIAWARILEGMQVFRTSNAARRFVRACSDRAFLPSDFLRDDGQTYISRFVNAYENEVITIFDTETTGLDVFNDDILQIAAVQLKNGAVVPGSAMSIYLESDKEIPEMLGDIVNPIIEERRHHQLISRQDALQRFVDYAQGTVLLGHNADFDIHILTNNLLRELPECPLPENLNNYLDSLLLIRLLRPGLRQYKLKYLLEVLHLEGENSHLADADVNATRALTLFCYDHAREMVAEQQSFITHKRVQERVVTLRNNYLSHFHHTANRLWTNDDNKDLLVEEMRYLYSVWVEEHLIEPLPTVEYIFRYVASDLLQRDEPPALALQIGRHILELNTLKEADLCGSATIDDKIFVTTVHKAKGLEFDNVIIFDVIEGRYPNYYSRENPSQVAEDARKLYVAMTRAKKRLMVMQSSSRIDYRGQRRPIALSRFMECIVDSLSPTHSCTLEGGENGPS
ncbi:MAG: ATP-binding domain-containing protein, partial [Prevotella salivae]|nr:ATP-binding domain-containing protein [Segatella salivae]